jgi:hypothetical protein
LFIPLVSHVFEETNLTLEEVHHLEDVRFSLVVQRITLCHIGFLEDLKQVLHLLLGPSRCPCPLEVLNDMVRIFIDFN